MSNEKTMVTEEIDGQELDDGIEPTAEEIAEAEAEAWEEE